MSKDNVHWRGEIPQSIWVYARLKMIKKINKIYVFLLLRLISMNNMKR